MQSLRVRRAEAVDHGIRPKPDPDGVDDQSIAFVMADGISVYGRNHLCGMRLIHPHLAEIIIVLVDDGDLSGLLQQLDIEVPKNIGHRVLETLFFRVRKTAAAYRHLP